MLTLTRILTFSLILNNNSFLHNLFDTEHLRILYYALIQPHLEYGIVAWGGATNNHMDCLEKVKKWLLKIIYNKDFYYATENLFNEIEMLDIRQLFCLSLLARKHVNKSELISIEHNYETRLKMHATRLPKTSKTVTQRSYYFLGPKLYNIIPPDIKLINSLKLFKSKIKKMD